MKTSIIDVLLYDNSRYYRTRMLHDRINALNVDIM